ncbi:DNA polymerase delta small subunit-like [Ctenocephalides felis]|uniref:DNA polymerase delta small subunit-like n=1 Tax=Ctenocephalides felis TaxID=7515 RepID=UPI000E6E2B86|nr:DNA polymerase delta small subunit-like [Ctenocephalides felis]
MVPDNSIVKRLIINYEDKSRRFNQTKKDYSRQFCHLYTARLKLMQENVLKEVYKRFGNKYPVKKLSEIHDVGENKCILVGTLFKHQELKPSILKEVSEENKLIPLPTRFNFVDDDDILILEDELNRIRLIGDIDIHQIATGVVCAVLGCECADGKFLIDTIIFSHCESIRSMILPKKSTNPQILLLSGLSLSSLTDNTLSLHIFNDWLSGLIGNGEGTPLVRIIIAGNSIKGQNDVKQKNAEYKQKNIENIGNDIKIIQNLDDFLMGICSTVSVDIMPGEFDPSNHMLPQQPLHHCLFPKAHVTGSLSAVTNPYHCNIDGCNILGSSGQPIQSLLAYTKIESAIEALKNTVKWRHMAPTAPDTLPCYPFIEKDPFIIEELPSIYFAGNCSEFATDLYEDVSGENVRLVCVPEFYKTQTAALIDLVSLDCYPISFAVDS